jgi:hypothetical protein
MLTRARRSDHRRTSQGGAKGTRMSQTKLAMEANMSQKPSDALKLGAPLSKGRYGGFKGPWKLPASGGEVERGTVSADRLKAKADEEDGVAIFCRNYARRARWGAGGHHSNIGESAYPKARQGAGRSRTNLMGFPRG